MGASCGVVWKRCVCRKTEITKKLPCRMSHWMFWVTSPRLEVPLVGEARLLSFYRELKADKQKKRRLQRKLDRERRANNPQNYDHKGRVKKGRLLWRESKGYKATRRSLAAHERKLASHRKSLHGRLVHEIVQTGKIVITEKLSYKAWQKQYGKSVDAHAPGMFMKQLRRTGASNWRHPA